MKPSADCKLRSTRANVKRGQQWRRCRTFRNQMQTKERQERLKSIGRASALKQQQRRRWRRRRQSVNCQPNGSWRIRCRHLSTHNKRCLWLLPVNAMQQQPIKPTFFFFFQLPLFKINILLDAFGQMAKRLNFFVCAIHPLVWWAMMTASLDRNKPPSSSFIIKKKGPQKRQKGEGIPSTRRVFTYVDSIRK